MFYKEIEFDFPTFINRTIISAELVIFGICDKALKVLMFQKQDFPDMGKYGLPSRYMEPDRSLNDTVRRLTIALDIAHLDVHEIGTLSDPARDMGKRAVSSVFIGAMDGKALEHVAADFQNGIVLEPREKTWVDPEFFDQWSGQCEVALDHAAIVQLAMRRLRRMINHTEIAFDFVPEKFTLGQLQRVHEIVGGKKINASTFRKRMLGQIFSDDTVIQSVEIKRNGQMGAPPTIYERIPVTKRRPPVVKKPKLKAKFVD